MTTKLTQQQRDMYNQRARERYANRTDAQKDHDRQIDRQRYARVHPNARRYRTPEQAFDDLAKESAERRVKHLKRRNDRS